MDSALKAAIITAIITGIFTVIAAIITHSPSPEPTSTTPTSTPEGFRIVEMWLDAKPSDYTGTCPVKITFLGRISVVGGGGTVSYKLLRSDNASAPVESLQFTSPGSKYVNDTWYIGGPRLKYSGWEEIKTFDPQEMNSSPARFKIQCQ